MVVHGLLDHLLRYFKSSTEIMRFILNKWGEARGGAKLLVRVLFDAFPDLNASLSRDVIDTNIDSHAHLSIRVY
jgi:hypothetical protein